MEFDRRQKNSTGNRTTNIYKQIDPRGHREVTYFLILLKAGTSWHPIEKKSYYGCTLNFNVFLKKKII